MTELADTAVVRQFMEAFGQEVRTALLSEPSPELRLLRGRIVMEEALELLDALGLKISLSEDEEPQRVDPKQARITVDEDSDVDIVETADALADLVVVTKGSALAFGIPVDAILLDEVGPSNMSKLGADGKPILREDGKILKADTWQPPNIKRVLRKVGYED